MIKHYHIQIFLFCIITIYIVSTGFYHGVMSINGSQDLKYFPSKLLREGIDFYNLSLRCSNWFMSQRPEYFHQLYFILCPFTILNWFYFKLFWFILNIILFVVFLLSLRKQYGFKITDFLFLLFPFFIGFPLTNTLGNGQFGIVIIFLTYFAWIHRENKIILPILLSLLTMKYSFGIPIIIGFFIMGYYRQVIISGFLSLIFPIIYAFQFKISILDSILLTFKVSSISSGIGSSDMMSLSRLVYGEIHFIVYLLVLLFLILLFGFSYYKKISKESILVCSILISIFGFFHLPYDWVVLILLYVFIPNQKIKMYFYVFTFIIFSIPRLFNFISFLGFRDKISLSALTTSPIYIAFIMSCFMLTFFLIVKTDVYKSKFAK